MPSGASQKPNTNSALISVSTPSRCIQQNSTISETNVPSLNTTSSPSSFPSPSLSISTSSVTISDSDFDDFDDIDSLASAIDVDRDEGQVVDVVTIQNNFNPNNVTDIKTRLSSSTSSGNPSESQSSITQQFSQPSLITEPSPLPPQLSTPSFQKSVVITTPTTTTTTITTTPSNSFSNERELFHDEIVMEWKSPQPRDPKSIKNISRNRHDFSYFQLSLYFSFFSLSLFYPINSE
jgi:hypothetical protein